MSIAFLPWSPLGGIAGASDLGTTYQDFATVARDRGVTPQVIALAWELAKSAVVIPIPGASRPQSILDSVTAATIRLRPEDVDRLDRSLATA
jgi:aryl-alcohol dehydrogenase-like predicted oxidoreductase